VNSRVGNGDILFSGGWLGMRNDIKQATVGGDLTGKMNSGLASFSAIVTNAYAFGGLCIRPSLGVEYGHYRQGALDATWDGETVFRNERSRANLVVLPMGARFTRNMPTMSGIMTPELRTRYIANVGDVSTNYNVWLPGSPTSALMATRAANRHAGDIGLGLSWNCYSGRFTLRGDYGYMFSRNYQNQHLSLMGVWRF